MKQRLIILFSVLLAAVLLMILIPRRGVADLGDYSGGSDYGGSDYGGSDYSSSDYGSYDSGGSGSGGGSCSTEPKDLIGYAICIVFIIGPMWTFIMIMWIKSAKEDRKNRGASPSHTAHVGATRTAQSKLTPIREYQALDPAFSPEALEKQLSDLYVKMQECCTKRSVEPIRPYFADALWQQFDRQVKQLKELRRTNYVERISVLSVDLEGFCQDKGEDVIVAGIRTRITDYTADDMTGKVISGSKTREKIMTYEYALSRPIERRAKQNAAGAITRVCPNCGAELTVNETVKCPYCDSVVTFGDHDWTVYSIKGISQRTL